MRILVAPNALKGSLTAQDAAGAIAEGLTRSAPEVETVEMPIADGGDGTVSVLASALGGEVVRSRVTDPIGRPIVASWGLVAAGRTAVIETASASGLGTLRVDERSPMATTSRGTGELIVMGLDRGCTRIIVGLGGSATVDAGVGALQALGVRFLDADRREIGPGGGELDRLESFDPSSIDARLRSVELIAAADVDNRLTGPDGAALVYGPQKGATPDECARLDAGLERFARIVFDATRVDLTAMPRAGASGGIGAALHALAGARLVGGAELVLDTLDFDRRLEGVDLVITAEGKLDAQTTRGKGPWGVAERARRRNVPCVVFAGQTDIDGLTSNVPFAEMLPINGPDIDRAEAMAHARELLTDAAERYGRALSNR